MKLCIYQLKNANDLWQTPEAKRHGQIFPCVSLSVMSDSAIAWTVAHQIPLSMGFPRQDYWKGQPFPFPGDLPNPGIKPRSPTLQADSLPAEPGKPTGLGSVSILQQIFPTQYLTGVSCIAGGFFTN